MAAVIQLICGKCDRTKPETEFYRSKLRSTGRQIYCKTCERAYADDNRLTINARRRRRRQVAPSRYLCAAARSRARRQQVEFSLTPSDVVIPPKCPVLGIELVTGAESRSDATATIDRINPAKGYLPGNILVVSWRANRLKSDATLEELQRISDFYGSL